MLIVSIVVRITMILNNNGIMITIMMTVHVIITITAVIRKVMMIIITMTILMINNGNRTDWRLAKSDDRKAGVRFVNHECDYRHNWTTQSPISIYHNRYNFRRQQTP